MISEGGLRKPERKAINIDNVNFWNEVELDDEVRRQFDICHSCRRCFNLCDSFPKLFDLIDEAPSMELDTVESKNFKNVVDACTLCDMCFMVSCPYVPPHEFAIDIPSIFIRYKAVDNKKTNNLVDAQIARTDFNGKLGVLFSILINLLLNKKRIIVRKFLSFFTGIDVSATLPKFNNLSFKSLFAKYKKKFDFKKNYAEKVLIFTSCYVNYNDSKIGESLVKVLEKNNVYMEQFYEGCCKMPQLEQGKVAEVKKEAEKTAKKIKEKIKQGFKVIAPIASCALMLKTHWPLLSPDNEDVKLLYFKDLKDRKGNKVNIEEMTI
jgi:glycerol-3-phosphate dehydrogenase subunit C